MNLADLTLEKIAKLTPGPEADALVAEARGWKLVYYSLEERQHYMVAGETVDDPVLPVPRYSLDWNCAMRAWFELGLGHGSGIVMGQIAGGQFAIWGPPKQVDEWTTAMQDFKVVPCDPSEGPLAICKAILVLYMEKDYHRT